MKMLKSLLFAVSLLGSASALAEEKYLLQALQDQCQERNPSAEGATADKNAEYKVELPAIDQIWRQGLHIDAGFGLQAGVYLVEGASRDYSIGSSIKTDVGYYWNERWAAEASSLIRFSRVNNFVVWGTELSLGVRYRLPSGWYDEQVPYFRYFMGSNINVIYLDNEQLPEFEQRYSRIQFEGPMMGIAFGGMRLSQSKRVWFWEVAATAEWLVRESGIQMDKDVPVVVARSSLDGRSQLYTIYVTMGAFIF